jgi:hypothetical protein
MAIRMVARNDITGDKIQTRDILSETGSANWDIIFPPKKKEQYVPPPLPNSFSSSEKVVKTDG